MLRFEACAPRFGACALRFEARALDFQASMQRPEESRLHPVVTVHPGELCLLDPNLTTALP
jgi:hypothetical protein